jgi:hypothetical protein
MKRTYAIVCAACAAILIAGWCAYTWRQGRPEAGAPQSVVIQGDGGLDRQIGAVSDRLSAKAHIADEVAAGRLSLREAAAAFRDLDAQQPRQVYDHPAAFPPGASEDERRCRAVIDWAVNAAPPDHAPALARRLEAELEVLLRQDPVPRARAE